MGNEFRMPQQLLAARRCEMAAYYMYYTICYIYFIFTIVPYSDGCLNLGKPMVIVNSIQTPFTDHSPRSDREQW